MTSHKIRCGRDLAGGGDGGLFMQSRREGTACKGQHACQPPFLAQPHHISILRFPLIIKGGQGLL
ncbi:hypothetical protein E2C01_000616 [Portunus trituberculatus]|uniref:Uncharacterized protein n=1 Tax=Portunus trituberculatus TaxID=210409 RepID=A0A5B7CFJ7_PORTR|nr:hypothetical protein [Portunus trituberculatus]